MEKNLAWRIAAAIDMARQLVDIQQHRLHDIGETQWFYRYQGLNDDLTRLYENAGAMASEIQ